MKLEVLEDYICVLMDQSLDKPKLRKRVDVICGELMDVLIEQERYIPDFIVNGDAKIISIEYGNHHVLPFQEEIQDGGNLPMKKLAWLGTTIAISGICFLIGFFVAP